MDQIVAGRSRIASIDVVRGLIMVLMALDHVRDFVSNLHFPPENLALGSAPLFFTRWLTHFCAPGFFLLAGIGVGVSMDRGKSPGELSRYLITRGLWLLVLELIITPVGWRFALHLTPAFALVLWALGWSMIAMALLIHLPRALVLAFSLALICLHNLLDPVQPAALGDFAGWWHVLHVPGFAIPNVLLVTYPLIPWLGVMALGFGLARVYDWDAPARRKFLVLSGLAVVAAFIVLRALNGFGNPAPWSVQRTGALTVASFLNLLKYPPSLQFLLMTLGPVLMALAATENARGRVASWLSVYGRVPLFFYVAHIFVVHGSGVLLAFIQSGSFMRITAISDPGGIPAWYGLPLPGVYLAWAVAVVLLYYPCRAFARLKDERRHWWLAYL